MAIVENLMFVIERKFHIETCQAFIETCQGSIEASNMTASSHALDTGNT